MDDYIDLLELLGIDMSIQICMYLDDPSDLVRLCLVSRSLRQFVIKNAFLKQLCLRMFPELSSISHLIEEVNLTEPVKMTSNDSLETNCLERNHKFYTYLAHSLTSGSDENCISFAYRASSTDDFPRESIQNTLEPGDRNDQGGASYWSSKGADDPSTPETLMYKLITDLCVITGFQVQPFEAFFQHDSPIYSAKAVRIHMGYSKQSVDIEGAFFNEPDQDYEFFDSNFIWTYSSPEFTMSQEKKVQKFELPQPVVCIGGVLKVELLGRVQRQETDNLYYICVSHVKAIGRPLMQAYDMRVHCDESGELMLGKKVEIGEESGSVSSSYPFLARSASLKRLIHSRILLGNNVVYDDEDGFVYIDAPVYEDDHDHDDDF